MSDKGSVQLKKGASIASRSRDGEGRSQTGQSKGGPPALDLDNADILDGLATEDVGLAGAYQT